MMQRILALLFALLPFQLLADDESGADQPAFYLEDGDRVVLLGGTIIEREQMYGEWELMLTCLYADADFTVRNLGWSGDTVWAESRGIFDPPEVGYQRMIDQIRELNPTVVLLGYGHNDAWAGEEGLEAFITQYEKLIDDIQSATEAETRYWIIMPHYQFSLGNEFPDPRTHNDVLFSYLKRIQNCADTRDIPMLNPIIHAHMEIYSNQELVRALSDDGVQFTSNGYHISGTHLRSQLTDDSSPFVSVRDGQLENAGCKCQIDELDATAGRYRFRCTQVNLADSHWLSFEDLPPGRYSLKIDDEVIETLDGSEWSSMDVSDGPDVNQREQLRQAIVRKNELYFHRWRPQNVTYLFGFRAHEQGNNAVEIPQFDPLIEEQEALIRELKHPVEHVWELAPAE